MKIGPRPTFRMKAFEIVFQQYRVRFPIKICLTGKPCTCKISKINYDLLQGAEAFDSIHNNATGGGYGGISPLE